MLLQRRSNFTLLSHLHAYVRWLLCRLTAHTPNNTHTHTQRLQEECLSLYAGACARGRDKSGGALIDPLYRLHATRLKLLLPMAVRQHKGSGGGAEQQQQQQGERLGQGQQQSQHHSQPHEPSLLQQLSRHCFLPDTAKHFKQAHTAATETGAPPAAVDWQGDQGAIVDLLFDDCKAAMLWCADAYKKGTGGAWQMRLPDSHALIWLAPLL